MAVIKARENSSSPRIPVAMMGVGNASQSQRGLMTAQDKVMLDTLVNLLVPVGVILTFASDIDPNEIYVGTTWEKIEGKFLLGSSNDYALGDTGGSADAVVVEHNHLTWENGNTSVQSYGNALSSDAKTSKLLLGATGNYLAYATGSLYTSVSGEDGTGKNMPPYEVVNYWKRTA